MADAGDTIFSKIIRGELPAQIVFESEQVLAFRDVNPQAPVHILVIPKRAIGRLSAADSADQSLLGELLLAAARIAEEQGLREQGYRVVVNNGKAAGQEVEHLHLHLLGGRKLGWPPG